MKRIVEFAKPDISEAEIRAVVETLRTGWLTIGPKTREFESKFAEFIGSKQAVAVNSCTGGLHISLAALGIGRGNEVITTPYTFASTVNVILHQGAKPVFVDIKDDFNIDETLIEDAITDRTRAILPVHYSGLPVEMDTVMDIAKRHGLYVIEDAAHAVGAEYKGRKIGTIGHATSFSFYTTKNMTTGEGGMITTDDEALADKARKLRLHGIDADVWKRHSELGSWYYEVVYPGFKYNMTDLQAAIGLEQLKRLPDFLDKRRRIAELYTNLLSEIDVLETPKTYPHVRHAWHLYVVKLRLEMLKIDRDRFIEELKIRGVKTSVHFIPIHIHPFYRDYFGFKPNDFPKAFETFRRVISLPLHTQLSDDDVYYVVDCIREIATTFRR